jgi:hypothetical protein
MAADESAPILPSMRTVSGQEAVNSSAACNAASVPHALLEQGSLACELGAVHASSVVNRTALLSVGSLMVMF